MSRSACVFFLLFGVLAVALRLAASGGQFQLDEIISLEIALSDPSLWQVLAEPTDNNHLLNTLVIHILGAGHPDWLYRLIPALASGAACLVNAWWARRYGRHAAAAVLLLTGASVFLVTYGSEARGYGYLLFFNALALWQLQRYLDHRVPRDGLIFGLLATAGLLAHLSFVFALAGFGAWTLWRRLPWREQVLLHTLPGAMLVALYLSFIRGLHFIGAPQIDALPLIARSLSLTLFGIQFGPLHWLAAALMLGLVVGSLWRCRAKRDDLWVPWLVTAVLAPLAIIVLFQPPVSAPRYLLVPAHFSLLLVGTALGGWIADGTRPRLRLLAATALLAGLLGNLGADLRQLALGRGDYRGALQQILAHSPPGRIPVIVDHPFRLGKLISYHGRNLPGFERIIYFRQGHPLTDQANWLMLHHFDGQPGLPRQVFLTRHKGTFVRVARYPYGGLSGIVIDVYRRVAGP